MPLLFAAALFVSAFLLFWVQPLVGKTVLPLLGGTPAVWNTCMLFFQAALLGGYAYALALTRWLTARSQALVHLGLLAVAALALPPALGADASGGAPEGGSPAWWLLKTLLVTVGPPFLVLSASAPLLQRWFSRTRDASASDPYFLYAASNAGSLLALLGFPALFEPWLSLGQQGRAWALGYGALAVLVAACAFVALRRGAPVAEGRVEGEASGELTDEDAVDEDASRVTWRRRLNWLALAFAPSSLVLGVTTYVTTDLAAVPLLWVIPLALYLLSFVVVFARRRVIPHAFAARLLPGAAVLLALVYLSGATEPVWFLVLFHLLFLFCAALVCHGRLADDRPAPARLAEFYLCLAAGGALGGLFNALVAPVAFDTLVEYPLVVLLACYLRPGFRRERGRLLGLRLGARDTVGAESDDDEEDDERPGALDLLLPLAMGLLAAALLLVVQRFGLTTVERVALSLGVPLFLLNHFFAPRPLRFALGLGAVFLASVLFSNTEGRTLHAARNFYGAHRVLSDDADSVHWLRHGSTLHGKQYTDAARRCEPTTYYHRQGPLGSVFDALRARTTIADVKVGHAPRSDAPRSIAVVGLGAGTTAAYARAGESWTFYEIDPAVVGVAREPAFFTYLSACAGAPVAVVVGDARLRLREAADGAYDLIALDAFSSDAVPAHLLTREALALYLSKLAPGGVLAFHVSNRALDLERVVGGISADARLHARVFNDDYDPDGEGNDPGHDPSAWVAVARTPEDLGALAADPRWLPLDATTHRLELWRDDFSDVLSVFRWR
ncbi:MAG TPA: fused MFS/spermidine synthase [Pyrinomonadaceae bacterium]|jgi:SAM-dependent methyltransferase